MPSSSCWHKCFHTWSELGLSWLSKTAPNPCGLTPREPLTPRSQITTLTWSFAWFIIAGTHTLNLHTCSSGWHHGHLSHSSFWHPPTGLLAFTATTDTQALQPVVWLQSHPLHTDTHERPSSRKRIKRIVRGITGLLKAALLSEQFSCFKVTNHNSPVLRFQNENSITQNEHSKFQNKLGRTASLSLSSILLGT